MRLLQLSDPHLLAAAAGVYRQRRPLELLRRALLQVPSLPDLLLITGDLCQDESWGGYQHLRELLQAWPTPVALLSGNHDHPQLLRAVLGRHAVVAPALLRLEEASLVLLDSHRAGSNAGWLGPRQLQWLQQQLAGLATRPGIPLLVAVHHPPLPIGDVLMDRIALKDGPALLDLLRTVPTLAGVLFGHVHQHWQGVLPGRPEVELLGCPSTLCSFGPVQPCPLGRAVDPGGRWLELGPRTTLRHVLLRWAPSSSLACSA
jgi:3',5'-cyclic-AMP phosphodiesterase